MGFTAVVMVLVIVWAIKNIAHELGVMEIAKTKIKHKYGEDDKE